MTNPSLPDDQLLHEGVDMLLRGLDIEQIRNTLAAKADNEEHLETLMARVRLVHYERRRKRGVVTGLIGCCLLIFGCVLVFVLQDHAGASRLALYVPSFVGSGLVLWALVDVLGW